MFSLGDEIEELSYGQTYCYLGFPEASSIDHDTFKEAIIGELCMHAGDFRCMVWGPSSMVGSK